jgi:hypothetical protein
MGETLLLINKPINHQSKYVATAKYFPRRFLNLLRFVDMFSVISFC